MNVSLALPVDEIASICRDFGVKELAVFGSALRDDFGPDSDIDFLVTFQNADCGPWMSKLQDMEEALAQLLGRPVDLVLRSGVLASENYIRRNDIIASSRTIYDA
jgi:predicted nucleotidyltransferase